MSQRVAYNEVAPEGMKIMMDMEMYTKNLRLIGLQENLSKSEFLKLTDVLSA